METFSSVVSKLYSPLQPQPNADRVFRGKCPLHDDELQSLFVNDATEQYFCFGCGKKGNVIDFIMAAESIDFPAAMIKFHEFIGKPLPQPEHHAKHMRIVEIAQAFYRQQLLESAGAEAGRKYLEERKVKPGISEAYGLGFAPDSFNALTSHLRNQGIDLRDAEQVGLLKKNEKGRYYDLFRNRLLFPICDMVGRPIGFGGRVLDDSKPKYINSTDSTIYHKNEVFFGLHMCYQSIREKRWAVIVEGYFDHLAIFQQEIPNVLATCGTAMTESHIRILKYLVTGKAFQLFDADDAGRKASVKAAKLLLMHDIPSGIANIPSGKDPDDYFKDGGTKKSFIELLRGSATPEDFLRENMSPDNLAPEDLPVLKRIYVK